MGKIALLFGYVLNFIYNIVNNYGLAIIIFSVLLKLILLPLTIKQQKSMKKSAQMQEKVKKIQIKYKNDAEQLNKATMELYKNEKYNPLSGCISSILQFVIFISVFYLVSRPLTYMKRVDSNLINQYTQEISQEEGNSAYPEIRIIELKGSSDEKVNINMNFLGLNLSKVPNKNLNDFKTLIIPILYILTMVINIKITTNLTKSKEQKEKEKLKKQEKFEKKQKEKEFKKNNDKIKINEEEVSIVEIGKENSNNAEEDMESIQNMTKSMNYMAPIISVSVALIAPLGLSLYWLISNVLQLFERVVIDAFSKKNGKE